LEEEQKLSEAKQLASHSSLGTPPLERDNNQIRGQQQQKIYERKIVKNSEYWPFNTEIKERCILEIRENSSPRRSPALGESC